MLLVVRVAQSVNARNLGRPPLLLVGVMVSTVVVLMVAHAIEVCVRSLAYSLVQLAPADKVQLYFAFVNYTTLGYGDITPVAKWQLLGPITAMKWSAAVSGWSTAVIFEVLRRTMQPRLLSEAEV